MPQDLTELHLGLLYTLLNNSADHLCMCGVISPLLFTKHCQMTFFKLLSYNVVYLNLEIGLGVIIL